MEATGQRGRLLRGQAKTFWPASGGQPAQPRNTVCLSLPSDKTKFKYRENESQSKGLIMRLKHIRSFTAQAP